jgi:hypothetical protein
VSEVSFENVAKVMAFTHVFQNGEKCNCFVYVHVLCVVYVFGKASSENECFVSKVCFQLFV